MIDRDACPRQSPRGADKARLEAAMKGRVVAQAELIGTYQKRK